MLALRFLHKEQVPGAQRRITEYGDIFPHPGADGLHKFIFELFMLLRHQISDPTDHKYSLGLQPWRYGECQAVFTIFHLP